MSDDFPDPFAAQPAPSIPPPPPPPAPPTGAFVPPIRPHSVPTGYVAYTGAAPRQSARGLGTAVTVLYWIVVGSMGLSIAAIYHRKTVVDDFINGDISRADIVDADDRARALIGVAGGVRVVLMLAAAIVTALWCRRIVRNAIGTGVPGLSVRAATFGWLPFAWWGVGFGQLRQALRGVANDPKLVNRWQFGFIATSMFSVFTRDVGNSADTPQALSDSLTAAMGVTIGVTVLLGGAALMGMRSVRQLNDAFSPE